MVGEARETDRQGERERGRKRRRKRWRIRRRRTEREEQMLRKSVTLEFKLPLCFSFLYAFFMPNFHHMAITHHILRKTRGGGEVLCTSGSMLANKVNQCSYKLHFPEKYNKTAVRNYTKN
jgi:hypothetical protein